MASLPDLPQTEIAIVEMTNAFRKDNKLAALKPNAALTAAARAFADYLGKSGKFGHEADGRQPAQRAEAQGYRYCTVGGEPGAQPRQPRFRGPKQLAREAIEGWKGSPGHRANMLRPYVTEIGVAVVRAPDREPKFISVQLSAGRTPLKIESTITTSRKQSCTISSAKRRSIAGAAHRLLHLCEPGKLTFEKRGSKRPRMSRATATRSWCVRNE